MDDLEDRGFIAEGQQTTSGKDLFYNSKDIHIVTLLNVKPYLLFQGCHCTAAVCYRK